MEIQGENTIGEIEWITEEVNIIFDQHIAEEILGLDTQTVEKTLADKQERDNEESHYFSYICTTNHIKRERRVPRAGDWKIEEQRWWNWDRYCFQTTYNM